MYLLLSYGQSDICLVQLWHMNICICLKTNDKHVLKIFVIIIYHAVSYHSIETFSIQHVCDLIVYSIR